MHYQAEGPHVELPPAPQVSPQSTVTLVSGQQPNEPGWAGQHAGGHYNGGYGPVADLPPSPSQPLDDQYWQTEPTGHAYNEPIYRSNALPTEGTYNAPWGGELLPAGLLFRPYLAGEKESRFASQWLWENDGQMFWEVSLGGRVGLWRYGSSGPNPEGFQFDMEGAGLVRLSPENNTDVEAIDFRFGLLATWREGPWSAKAGYYHISSHLGDEFLLRNRRFPRLNYVRDSLVTGASYDWSDSIRTYVEAAYAVGHQDGALPLEFQYGAEYSSPLTDSFGGPFAAINGHTREDFDWQTSVNVVTGWQWRGVNTDHRFRAGVQYYSGPALQYSFAGRNEQLVGCGLWFDY
jgi:hypothetical protein